MQSSATEDMIRLENDERSNFQSNVEELGVSLEAFDGLYNLYDQFWLLFQKAIAKKDPESIEGLLDCYQLMRQDLLKGALSICRGYIADAQFQSRRIIETVATMIEILKSQEKANIWSNLTNEAEIRDYVANFMVFKLVKKNLSATAVGHYEGLCLFVHPSAASMAERSELHDDGKHTLQLFDVRSDEDTPRLRKDLLIFLTMQFNVLNELADSMRDEPTFDSDAWKIASARYHRIWCQHAKELVNAGDLPELTEAFRAHTAAERE